MRLPQICLHLPSWTFRWRTFPCPRLTIISATKAFSLTLCYGVRGQGKTLSRDVAVAARAPFGFRVKLWGYYRRLPRWNRPTHIVTTTVPVEVGRRIQRFMQDFRANFVNPMEMKVEHHYGLPAEGEYSSHRIEEIGHHQTSPPSSSPSNDYGSFEFHAPSEPMYSRSFEPSFSAPPTLHPLNTSEATLWPSQITNPSEHTSPPVSLPVLRSAEPHVADETPPMGRPRPPTLTRQTQGVSTSRRTLSDDDRRRMCKYHDDNPSIKQTEIGGR